MRIIDADALKKKARYAFKSNTGGHIPPIVSTDDIDNAPTIEAELSRDAHWIHFTKKHNGEDVCYVRCSHCGKVRPFDYELYYCNKCGSKMYTRGVPNEFR